MSPPLCSVREQSPPEAQGSGPDAPLSHSLPLSPPCLQADDDIPPGFSRRHLPKALQYCRDSCTQPQLVCAVSPAAPPSPALRQEGNMQRSSPPAVAREGNWDTNATRTQGDRVAGHLEAAAASRRDAKIPKCHQRVTPDSQVSSQEEHTMRKSGDRRDGGRCL